jgi:glycosyltransferase involved in cell wall biosynthesis/SAM-dependent methyltransferase
LDAGYQDWVHKRNKFIIDHFGMPFFRNKTVLDLGCGYGDIGASLWRLGADVLCVDARDSNINIGSKKYPGLKFKQINLDTEWNFNKFDIILDIGLLCHLVNAEDHLHNVCQSTSQYLILETAVCDSDDPTLCARMKESSYNTDLSFSGIASRPTAAMIEKILSSCGMGFKRMFSPKLNSGPIKYDWNVVNSNSCDLNMRRMWIANKVKEVPRHMPRFVQPDMRIIPDQVPTVSTKVSLPTMSSDDKKFVIVIPSYNNRQWCEKNIGSALNQNYSKYRIIFTDDASSDGTFEQSKHFVEASGKTNLVTLIKNETRIGALANLYNMIHSCDDDEIVLTLDGDDWLSNENVLNRLNSVYRERDVWLTYGQYRNSNDGIIGVAQPYPPHVINSNSFRSHVWSASHLRTFYAWLFKKIRKEDLCENGQFFPMTWDFAMMFPMLEMAGPHSTYIDDILYIYNLDNPINDHKVNRSIQARLDGHIRHMARYPRCEAPIFEKKRAQVGLLLIATNKYVQFTQPLILSADKYFLTNVDCDVTYYVFSDTNSPLQSSRNIVQIPIEHKQFPFASMDRFKHFCAHADTLARMDYLYYTDVDNLFVDYVGNEIFGNLVGVQHCGYIRKVGTYETNPGSVFYVDSTYPRQYKQYFGGGFSGGKRESYLELAKWCSEMIDKDVANGIIPVWHDETALNRYFLDHDPDVILSPSYHYPQSNIENYKSMWRPDVFAPKILLLDKNHGEIRQ